MALYSRKSTGWQAFAEGVVIGRWSIGYLSQRGHSLRRHDLQINIHSNIECALMGMYLPLAALLYLYLQQTATMLGFDNSQISEQAPEDTSRSEMQELNHLREMLPEPINRLDEYLIHEQTEEQSEESLTGEQQSMMLKIRDQTQMILELEEKLYYYRSECMRLIDENQQIKVHVREAEQSAIHKDNLLAQTQRKLEDEYVKASHLEKQIKSQEEKIKELSKAVEKGMERKQKQISFRNTYNQELLSKQLLIQEKVIVELTCKNQKMLKINAFLESELRQAEEKLINFEIDVQQKMCSILVGNVSRLKENQSHISRNSHSYSLTQTHSNPKANFTSMRPCIEENKTVKLQNSQDMDDQQGEFKTIQKDRILKTSQYKYDYKLQPVESPKPQRKSNHRIQSFHAKKDQKQQSHKQSAKYNF